MRPADLVNVNLSMELDRSRRMSRLLVIAERYRKGVKVVDIADEFECSIHTVLRIARAMDLAKRPKSDDPARRTRVIELAKGGGLSQKQIARACGCSIALVSRIEHEVGLNRYQTVST